MKFVIQTLLYATIILISKAGFGPNVGDYCNENNNQCDAANGIFYRLWWLWLCSLCMFEWRGI